MGKSTINGPFSIATLNYQAGYIKTQRDVRLQVMETLVQRIQRRQQNSRDLHRAVSSWLSWLAGESPIEFDDFPSKKPPWLVLGISQLAMFDYQRGTPSCRFGIFKDWRIYFGESVSHGSVWSEDYSVFFYIGGLPSGKLTSLWTITIFHG